jgi:hypothetical protein
MARIRGIEKVQHLCTTCGNGKEYEDKLFNVGLLFSHQIFTNNMDYMQHTRELSIRVLRRVQASAYTLGTHPDAAWRGNESLRWWKATDSETTMCSLPHCAYHP